MAAAMNGIAAQRFIPYGGTFLVFSDYCKNSIRLSAADGALYVSTYDSIALVKMDLPTNRLNT